jgi:hypothetical protein
MAWSVFTLSRYNSSKKLSMIAQEENVAMTSWQACAWRLSIDKSVIPSKQGCWSPEDPVQPPVSS